MRSEVDGSRRLPRRIRLREMAQKTSGSPGQGATPAAGSSIHGRTVDPGAQACNERLQTGRVGDQTTPPHPGSPRLIPRPARSARSMGRLCRTAAVQRRIRKDPTLARPTATITGIGPVGAGSECNAGADPARCRPRAPPDRTDDLLITRWPGAALSAHTCGQHAEHGLKTPSYPVLLRTKASRFSERPAAGPSPQPSAIVR